LYAKAGPLLPHRRLDCRGRTATGPLHEFRLKLSFAMSVVLVNDLNSN
jgi:hypothetical protein